MHWELDFAFCVLFAADPEGAHFCDLVQGASLSLLWLASPQEGQVLPTLP